MSEVNSTKICSEMMVYGQVFFFVKDISLAIVAHIDETIASRAIILIVLTGR